MFDTVAYTDSTQPNLNRARGDTDRTHSFSASLVLALPTLQGKSPVVRGALGDWEVATIGTQLRFEVYNLFNTVNFLGCSLNTAYNAEDVVFDTGDAATATRILSATPPGDEILGG